MEHLRKYYPLYVLAILTIVFFVPVLFQDYMYCYRDFFRIWYGDKKVMVDMFQRGEIPLWLPYRFCGIPFLANISCSCLHPYYLMFFLFSFQTAAKLFLILSFYMGGLGVYLLLMQWGLARFSSLIGSLCFMFSGTFVAGIVSPLYLASYAWVPLFFFAFHVAITKGSWMWGLLAAFIGTFLLFSGDPQTFVVTTALLCPYHFVVNWEGRNKIHWIRNICIFGMLLVAIVALGAIQILPTWELLQNSTRKVGLTYEESSTWSLTPVQFLQLFCPSLQGYPTIQWFGVHAKDKDIPFILSIFMGTLGLFSFFAGVFLPGNRYKYLSFAIMGIALLISFGFYTPVFYYWWKYVPFLGKFRYPSKYMIFFVFFGSTAVALHFEQLFFQWQSIWEHYHRRIIAGLAIALVCHCLMYVFIALPVQMQNMIPNRTGINKASIPICFSPHAARQVLHLLLFFVILTCIWFVGIRNSRRRTVLACFLVIASSVQMVVHGWQLTPTCPAVYYTQKSWGESCLDKNDLDHFRYYASTPSFKICEYPAFSVCENLEEIADLAFGSHASIWEFSHSHGYEAALLYRMDRFRQLHSVEQNIYFTSARYLILLEHQYRSQFEFYPILDKKGKILFCENPQYAPRVWFPERVSFAATMEQAENLALIWKMAGIKREAYIEYPATGEIKYSPSALASANIVKYHPHRVEIDVKTDMQRWLILTDAFYPGWKCEIDGRTTQIYPALLAFRAIQVEKGEHKVVFTYLPRSFLWGVYISVTSWLLSLLSMGLLAFMPKRSICKAHHPQ